VCACECVCVCAFVCECVRVYMRAHVCMHARSGMCTPGQDGARVHAQCALNPHLVDERVHGGNFKGLVPAKVLPQGCLVQRVRMGTEEVGNGLCSAQWWGGAAMSVRVRA